MPVRSIDLPLFDQPHQRRRRYGLGDGRERKDGVWRHRLRVSGSVTPSRARSPAFLTTPKATPGIWPYSAIFCVTSARICSNFGSAREGTDAEGVVANATPSAAAVAIVRRGSSRRRSIRLYRSSDGNLRKSL